jgi:hypothetical protein
LRCWFAGRAGLLGCQTTASLGITVGLMP